MIVDDDAVPYPRQYVLSPDTIGLKDIFQGWLVPFAGAPAYLVWWTDGFLQKANLRAESRLQGAKMWQVQTYSRPDLIVAAVYEHAKAHP